VSDDTLLLELTEAVRKDSEKPVLDQRLNPLDPIAIEIILHEADFAIERYMEKWKEYRDRFSNPSLYDNFILEFQMKVRKDVKSLIGTAQQFIAEEIETERQEEDDEYEGQN